MMWCVSGVSGSAGEFALRGVVFDEIGEVVGGNEVIDRNHFDFLAEEALFRDGAKHETSDSFQSR